MSLALPPEVEEIWKCVKPILETLAKSVINSLSLDEIKKQLDKLKPHKLTPAEQIGKIITEEMIKFEEKHPDLEGHTF